MALRQLWRRGGGGEVEESEGGGGGGGREREGVREVGERERERGTMKGKMREGYDVLKERN